MLLLDVLIEHQAASLNRPFSYIYKGNRNIAKGMRVLVTFANRKIVGFVKTVNVMYKSIEELEEEKGFLISEIDSILDDECLLSEELMTLAEHLSDYYFAPLISVLSTMLPPSLKPKSSSLKGPKIAYETYVTFVDGNEEDLTPKQIEWLRLLSKEKIILKKDFTSSCLKTLIDLGRLKFEYVEKRRLKLPESFIEQEINLTQQQQDAIIQIKESNAEVFLLQGVTGSGKTEVYLSLSEELLKKGKTVLMLVPEIALTPMMVNYFSSRFKDEIAILHSDLTPGEKYDEYRRINEGKCRIVVGARSAVFAPLKNIGLIILDEEHVETYKQDTLPFYHAREVAILRAKTHHAKLILGSATPSLETKARAMKGVYELVEMPTRVYKQELPETRIVNLLDSRNLDKESAIFSLTLRREIATRLKKNEQVMLLLNRRGYSPYVQCRNCGEVMKCPYCGISLIYHRHDNMLKCHHCDYVMEMPKQCPHCESRYFSKQGFGTEKVEEEIHRLFPNARSLRLDSDVVKVRHKINEILDKFKNHEADILIGTQIIAKGHSFENVTLVGVVLADIGLTLPSYRSSERTFQLITQAVGRSGRGQKKGTAIIQTYMPDHYAVTLGAKQDYQKFFYQEMQIRHFQQYPPYTYLIKITLGAKDLNIVIEFANILKHNLENRLHQLGSAIGPATPYVPYENSYYKRTLLVKYKNYDEIAPIIQDVTSTLMNKSALRLQINVDPFEV